MAADQRTVGIDVGATLAKVALRNATTILTEHHASGALEAVRRRVEALAPAGVVLTGGGADQLAPLLAGMPVAHVDEITAWACGGALVAAEEGMPLPARYLLVSLGTGTSIVRVEDGTGVRVGGTALGGGTVLGLGRLLVGAASFAELTALAAEGDRRKVDLLVGDIYRVGAGTLPGDLTAASFAKLDSTRPADVAHAVMGLVGENVALVAGGLARAVGVETLVYCGSTLSDNPALCEIVARVTAMLGLDGRFLARGAYCGAVGAAAFERS
jgi:type II pantothenate kinase